MFRINFKVLPLSGIMIVLCFNAFSQKTTAVEKTVEYNKFLLEYKTRIASTLDTSGPKHLNTFVHPYAVIASDFIKEKVYADPDALKLLQVLNPNINMNDPNLRINVSTKLITPHYVPPSQEILEKFNRDYLTASAPDPTVNEEFANTVINYNNLIDQMAQSPNTVTLDGLWDSLNLIKTYVLPVFNQHSGGISQTQMRYINNEVSTLTRLFQKKATKKFHERSSFIIRDIINLSNIRDWSTATLKPHTSNAGSAVNHVNFNYKNLLHAGFTNDSVSANSSISTSVGDRPFKCNVYVFRIDSTKQMQDTDPVAKKYFLWIGDKASFGDLIPGCDSASIGFPKNGNLASTLPVTIGFGSYIFIIRDRYTGITFTKEVSINTETEFEKDGQNVRKIIFTVYGP
jgi:hypothetical protein